MRALAALSRFVGNTFAYWVLLFAVVAFLEPNWFIGLKSAIVPLLGLVMFGMGLTLKLDDFAEVARHPWRVALGVVAHFVIMPGVAWLLCQAFHLPPEIAVGVILVGCCPSGTSSNVMTWLARGDLALSVAIAAVTTLLAPLLTPALIWLLASAWLPVSASQAKIAESGLLIMAVVMLHNSFGYLLGYFTGRVFKLPLAQRKSLALEVGMQNSGLGAALASAHFSPLAAVPSALFSVWHNISGALLSTYFRRMSEKEDRRVLENTPQT
jgi:bile acid:Na+ symporter, BASS family